MKTKKLLGAFTAVLVFCAVLNFCFTVSPSISAATTEKSEVETITTETIPSNAEQTRKTETIPSNAAEQTEKTVVQPDSNAISKEQAIENAMKGLEEYRYGVDFKALPVTANYVSDAAAANAPSWIVVFRIDFDEYIYDKLSTLEESPEKFQGIDYEIVTEDGQEWVKYHHSYSSCLVVKINALTGDYIHHVETDPASAEQGASIFEER